MNETGLDWRDLQDFLVVAREGGLSAAARASGKSAPTLGRHMLALERSLGQQLFIRHDRGYELTSDGQRLMQNLQQIEARILRSTRNAEHAPAPSVRISAGSWTTLALLDRIDEITGTPADIRLCFLATEDILNIPRRQTAIGFRNQRPTEETLAGRKLSRVDFAPYAMPDAPDRWIRVLGQTPSARWMERTIGTDALFEVSAPRNSLDLVKNGHGVALLPTFIGEAQSDLVRRGDVIPELSHDQWIVTHQDDRYLPEIRRVIDRLCSLFSPRY